MIPDKSYTHSQNASSNEWLIQHNLGKYPSVTVVDSGENVVIGEVTYLDENNLKIEFQGPFVGKAYLN